jgi:hypothetical protein
VMKTGSQNSSFSQLPGLVAECRRHASVAQVHSWRTDLAAWGIGGNDWRWYEEWIGLEMDTRM